MSSRILSTLALAAAGCLAMFAAPASAQSLVVPNEIQQPGTQQGEVGNLESPGRCDNCHGGYNKPVEPGFNWRGGMMANATRDPIFWATLAIAEQGFKGSGDLCIRCHSTSGWYGGRSTPTDGSNLTASDADGVECDACHKMTNPAGTEHPGVMRPPFVANDGKNPATGYHGSGMLSLSAGSAKLGPYDDAVARHQFMQSKFHRDVDFCGSCHDVSNPAVGDLAHNQGKQATADPVLTSAGLGAPVGDKAAFKNFPYKYGVVERTFSEYKAGLLSQTRVSSYASLPADLQAGAIKAAFDSAKGDYADGTPRYFSCQTCHMRAVTGRGANKNDAPIRTDLPLHDMTGGNYWIPDVILYQNARGMLRLGGGLTATQIEAITAGKLRAQQQLELAAALTVSGTTNPVLRVTNLTGHKLISGYPEGRRMWLNVKWFDSTNKLISESGKYDVVASVNGTPVKSIVDIDTARIYEAHYGMTQEWANQLLGLGHSPSMPLSFDRVTGNVSYTLGQLAAQLAGSSYETFHFVLNNTVLKDNRIPTYGMSYEIARQRNALPVPANRYPTDNGRYRHYDEMTLAPPSGAVRAEIRLLYQPTSWEYIQFLYRANNRSVAFLANEGDKLLESWLNTGMAEPYVMASTTWGTAPPPPSGGGGTACAAPAAPQTLAAKAGKKSITLSWKAGSPAPNGGYRIFYDQSGKLQYRAGTGATTLTYKDTGLTSRQSYTYVATAWQDCNCNGTFDAGTDLESPVSNKATATAQ
jgi:hypothetical protein